MLRIAGAPWERARMCASPEVPRKRCVFPAVPAGVRPQIFSRNAAAFATSSTCSSTLWSLMALLREAEDQARGAQRVTAFQRLEELRPGEAGLQRAGLEVGGDHRHDVVLRRVAL